MQKIKVAYLTSHAEIELYQNSAENFDDEQIDSGEY